MQNIRHFLGRRYVDVKRSLTRFYNDYVQFYLNFYVYQREPVVIYQMGKVGSSTLYHSLQGDTFVRKTHSLNNAFLDDTTRLHRENNLYIHWAVAGRLLRRHLIDGQRQAHFITMTRDPVSRNVAEFFQNYKMYIDPPYDLEAYSTPELRECFLEQSRHDICLTWYDREFQEILGVDVYAEPFPHEKGYQTLSSSYGDILIMRIETDDSTLEQAVQQFLNKPDFRLQAANVGAQKSYAAIYRRFKQEVRLPAWYLDKMLNSRYAEHFYTPAERDAVRERWIE